MYSQIHGIYFSHTAILSGPDLPEPPATEDEPVPSSQSELSLGRKAQSFVDRYFSATRSVMKKREYDVFLSFRGEDTRRTFTGHLYNALMAAGINTFIDNEDLQRGQTISKKLKRAIERSAISVVVLSSNYAESAWCLEELRKIMECQRTLGQIVIPVFYGVTPSEVRNQTGKVDWALSDLHSREMRRITRVYLKANYRMTARKMLRKKLKRWGIALTEVANCSGWDSSVIRNDAQLIKKIVDDVLRKTLSTTNLHVAAYPVGIYSRAQELISSLKLGSDDHKVRIVGICGMAGMGKTTIAKSIYNMFNSQFGSNRSFLENVRQNWDQPHRRVHLQKQLLFHILKKKVDEVDSVDKGIQVIKERISSKKALVIVDDVDHRDQLNAIAGSRDWFGPGSIIIITTRNRQLLKKLKVDATYMVPEMNDVESLELFSWHAFRERKPTEKYRELSKSVVKYCGGLPLALTVLGSHLSSMSKSEWISELEKLKKIPHEDVLEKLRISFDGLRDHTVKAIFLDISCFFIGMDMNYVQEVLDGCGLFAETGLRCLLERCLITVSEKNKIMMHDLLRDMGRAVVEENLTNRPGERSRLWFREDVSLVLRDETGTQNIEGLALDMERLDKVSFTTKAFAEMQILRLLQLNFVQLDGSYKHLSKNLRWLCWNGFPLTSIPRHFDQRKLVAINLQYSNLEQVWENPKLLKDLKILNLSHSNYLTQTPDFSNLPNLRQLILKYCKRMSKVHHSIGNLDELVLVNLKNCEILKKLPRNFYKLKSLKTLILSGCSMFDTLDEDIGEMESLKILHADNTRIREVPQTIVKLTSLTDLSLCGLRAASPGNLGSFHYWCRSIMPGKNSKPVNLLPPSLQGLKSLTTLSLMDCNLTDDALPKDLGSLSSLVTLRLDSNSFHSLPSNLKGLSRLRSLSLDDCELLQSIIDLPTNLKALYAANCKALKIMPDMSEMSNLVILELANCHELVDIPGLEKLLKSVSLQLQNKNSIATTSKESFLQVSTTTEFGSLFLHDDDIPGWFTCISNGSSISFEVPLLADSSLKGCLVRTVYSYSPKPTLFSAFPSVSVVNKTQRRSFFFDLIALSHHGTTCEGHLWQGLVSNDELKLKGGDKVEVSLDFGEYYMVKKTGVYLLFGSRVSAQRIQYDEPGTSSSWFHQMWRGVFQK